MLLSSAERKEFSSIFLLRISFSRVSRTVTGRIRSGMEKSFPSDVHSCSTPQWVMCTLQFYEREWIILWSWPGLLREACHKVCMICKRLTVVQPTFNHFQKASFFVCTEKSFSSAQTSLSRFVFIVDPKKKAFSWVIVQHGKFKRASPSLWLLLQFNFGVLCGMTKFVVHSKPETCTKHATHSPNVDTTCRVF